jgi:hypothetical protein
MRYRFVVLAALLTLSGIAVAAQTPRPSLAPGNTVLIAAYTCAADQLARADALMDEIVTPVLNKYQSAGQILNWGYMATYMGAAANRQVYVWAADPVALVQARSAYLPEIMAGPRFAEFSKICGSSTISLHNLIAASGAPAR